MTQVSLLAVLILGTALQVSAQTPTPLEDFATQLTQLATVTTQLRETGLKIQAAGGVNVAELTAQMATLQKQFDALKVLVAGGTPPPVIPPVVPPVVPPLALAPGCPPLPAATGNVVNVSTAVALVAALASSPAGTTILIADGTYDLPRGLHIQKPQTTLRGASGNRAAVILDGRYAVDEGIYIDVDQATVADLTVMRTRTHPIHIVGASGARLYNVRVADAGQQLVKINAPQTAGPYSDNGVIACSLIELTFPGRAYVEAAQSNCYTGGIDALQARGWNVRDNQIRNVYCSAGDPAQHAIHFWTTSRDTVIERNVVVNNARGIGLGLSARAAGASNAGVRVYGDLPMTPALALIDSHGGAIQNNIVICLIPQCDTGIGLESANNARVDHNTVYMNTGLPMDLRFSATNAKVRNNLLLAGVVSVRDGATPTQIGNVTGVATALFVDAGTGDLHLQPGATMVIDRGASLAEVTTDFDGQPRGTASDVGADEFVAGSVPLLTLPPMVLPPTVMPPVVVVPPVVVPPVVVLPPPLVAGSKQLQQGDLVYQGAFRLPQAAPGATYGFGYSQTGFAFNPARNSLFINNHQYGQQTAEMSIPTPSLDLNTLPFSTYLQPPGDLTDGNIDKIGAGGSSCCVNGDWMGGLMVYNGKIIGTSYAFYDGGVGNGTGAQLSHFTSSLVTTQAGDFRGMFKVGNLNPGFYGGWMTEIPPEWRAAFGGPAMTGQCCRSVISRTSLGPAAFVFDPDQLGVVNPVPATPVVYYPMAHTTLGGWQDTAPSPLFNMSTKIGGMAFPAGTRTALFIGRTEMGIPCYGPDTNNPGMHLTTVAAFPNQHYCYTPDGDQYTGPHCHSCQYFVWAYDANDLVAVKNGTKQPWDVVPYASWPFTLPGTGPAIGYEVQGIGYDPSTQRLWVSAGGADRAVPGGSPAYPAPVIHEFKVTVP